MADKLSKFATNERERQRAAAICECSTEWFVARNADGVLCVAKRCRERQCPECQRARGMKYQRHYEERISQMAKPKMLTLTLKTKASPLRDEITRLLKCFHNLRRHSIWQQSVKGGFYVVELTRSSETRLWHVHLHAVIDSKFIDQEWLSETWKRITGDSFIVHIETADKGTAKYLASYVKKGIKGTLESFEEWPMYYELKGRRMAGTFGDEPPINDDSDSGNELQILGRLTDIIDAAYSGDRHAQSILAELLTTPGDLTQAPTAHGVGPPALE